MSASSNSCHNFGRFGEVGRLRAMLSNFGKSSANFVRLRSILGKPGQIGALSSNVVQSAEFGPFLQRSGDFGQLWAISANVRRFRPTCWQFRKSSGIVGLRCSPIKICIAGFRPKYSPVKLPEGRKRETNSCAKKEDWCVGGRALGKFQVASRGGGVESGLACSRCLASEGCRISDGWIEKVPAVL